MLLVRALAAAGDQAGAFAAFDEYRDRLAAETGLAPTPQARKIRQRILACQPEGGQPGPSRAARPAGSGGSSPGRMNPFLGRDEECAAIADAAAGRGPRVVLVTGPSGIGKSALLARGGAAGSRARAERAGARSGPGRGMVAGGPAARPGRQTAAGAGRRRYWRSRRPARWPRWCPGLAVPPGAALGSLDEETRRAFALQGAVRLIAAAARPRCLIVTDDLQWADPISLTLLGLLLRRLDGVSLAAAYRADGTPGAGPAEALGLPAALITGITLGPLPARVIRGLFSDQLLAEAIIRQAGRTPFTVTEVIAALARQGAITRDSDGQWQLRPGRDAAGASSIVATGIGQAAGNRLAVLPSRWRDMLGLLALLGRPAPPSLLTAASSTGLHSALDTLEGLGRAGLAQPRAAGLGARPRAGPPGGHRRDAPLGNRAVATRFSPRRCGSAALTRPRPRRHLAASGDNDGAARAYATAARHQLDRIRDREAMRLAETGLSLAPGDRTRAALLEARGEARRRGGQLTAARADFTAELDSLDDPASRSRVLAQLAILDARTVGAARGGELAGLAIAEAGDQPAALGQALAAGAIIDLTEGNLARARHRVRRAARLLDQAGDSRGSARLLYWRAMACFIGGRLLDAADQLDRLAHLPAAAGEVLRLWSPHATRGHVLAFLGRAGEGLAEIDETLAWARAARHPAVEAECLWHRAEALAILGQAAEAIESAEQSAGIADRIGHAEWTAAAHRGLGIACEAAGLPGRAGIRLPPLPASRREHPAVQGMGSGPARRLPGRPGTAARGRTARPGRTRGRDAAHPPRGPVGTRRTPRQSRRRRGMPRSRHGCPGAGPGRRLPNPGPAAPRTRRPLTRGHPPSRQQTRWGTDSRPLRCSRRSPATPAPRSQTRRGRSPRSFLQVSPRAGG